MAAIVKNPCDSLPGKHALCTAAHLLVFGTRGRAEADDHKTYRRKVESTIYLGDRAQALQLAGAERAMMSFWCQLETPLWYGSTLRPALLYAATCASH
jgi:hypothetical protein